MVEKSSSRKKVAIESSYRKEMAKESRTKERVGSSNPILRPHNASFDFRFPDHVAGLQSLNAHLALL